MLTLFISTYSSLITIGLLKDGKVLSFCEKESEKSHSIYLVPMIDSMLSDNNLDTDDLNEIIVVIGPGSFTGVRLGVTVAKTLAYTLNIPIKTISSIEALACSIEEKNKIITIDDNKGKYVGVFKNNVMLNEMCYVKAVDFDSFISDYGYNVFSSEKFNLELIYEFLKDKEYVNAHTVNPIYIKEIDALNGR